MLSPKQILQLIIGLRRANDSDLLQDDAVLAASCDDADRSTVQAIAIVIKRIYAGFDYENSREFQASIQGKSPLFRAMMLRTLLNKHQELMDRLGHSLANLLESDEAFDLVSPAVFHELNEVRELAHRLRRG